MHMGSTEPLLARSVFVRSIKALGWQSVAQKFGNTIFREKPPDFFEIHRTSDTSMASVAL